jgi:gamma-glutamylcyclotransferase (GGCT)/AIG2-like uncharacterized protein YtfP
MHHLIFVYGTLKRGCRNHHHLAGQKFVGAARTVPGYTLFDLGGYPGLVAKAADRAGVTGEIWSVDAEALRRLDAFEGVPEGLYRRAPIALQAPHADTQADAYYALHRMDGRREVGAEWRE